MVSSMTEISPILAHWRYCIFDRSCLYFISDGAISLDTDSVILTDNVPRLITWPVCEAELVVGCSEKIEHTIAYTSADGKTDLGWIIGHKKIWWLCLIPISTTRFTSDLGYRMAKNLIGLYKEILFINNDMKFLNIEWRTLYSLKNFEDHFRLHASVNYFFRLQYVWFPVHLYIGLIPNSSGQLAELLVCIIPLE